MNGPQKPVRVFVSYSHRDDKLCAELLRFLDGLTDRGFHFWSDREIYTGERWDERIRQVIARSDIALALVSQDFLNSPYCKNVEVRQFLQRQQQDGLIVYPIILSPCNWTDEPWLTSTQYQPRQGRTIEEHFVQRGKRKRLYLTILMELALLGGKVRVNVIGNSR